MNNESEKLVCVQIRSGESFGPFPRHTEYIISFEWRQRCQRNHKTISKLLRKSHGMENGKLFEYFYYLIFAFLVCVLSMIVRMLKLMGHWYHRWRDLIQKIFKYWWFEDVECWIRSRRCFHFHSIFHSAHKRFSHRKICPKFSSHFARWRFA